MHLIKMPKPDNSCLQFGDNFATNLSNKSMNLSEFLVARPLWHFIMMPPKIVTKILNCTCWGWTDWQYRRKLALSPEKEIGKRFKAASAISVEAQLIDLRIKTSVKRCKMWQCFSFSVASFWKW